MKDRTGLARIVARTVEIVRVEGPSSPWFRVLALIGYRRVHLFTRTLDGPPAAVEARLPVTVRRLDAADIADYLALRPDATESDVRGRLEAGHYCFGVYAEGRLVHSDWAFTGRARIEFLGRDLDLAPDEYYASDAFTLRAYRGQNIAAVRAAYMREYLRQRGYRRGLAVVFPENRPAYRAILKVGYRVIATIGYVKLGPWRRDFYRAHDADVP